MAFDMRTGPSPGFDPELMTRFWQQGGMRLMRANERVLNGLMTATKREMELAQDMARFNLGRLQSAANAKGPEAAAATVEQNFTELGKILSEMRGITEELWKTFSDASNLLLEGGITEARKATAEIAAKAGQVMER